MQARTKIDPDKDRAKMMPCGGFFNVGAHVTTHACTKGVWKGLLEDGTSLTIAEDMVREQFGFRFVAECQIDFSKVCLREILACRLTVVFTKLL